MSSNERSHSAVRNLRSIFENKASAEPESPNARGRSSSGISAGSGGSGRPISRVRSSFVAVEPPRMATPSQGSDMSVSDMQRASSIQARRGSFSVDNADPLSIAELKQGVADERERRVSRPDLGTPIPEGAVDSTAATPAVEPREEVAMGSINHTASKLSEMTVAPGNENQPPADPQNEPPANPDKPNTGAEEEEGEMKPAEPVNEAAVSGGEALPPPTEDLTKQNVESEAHGLKTGKINGEAAQTPLKPEAAPKPEATPQAEPTPKSEPAPAPKEEPAAKAEPTPKTTTPAQKRGSMAPQTSISKPSSVSRSTKDSARDTLKSPDTTQKSPPSTAKSPVSPTAAPAPEVTRKTSRTSLAAPTAASKARTGSSEKRASSANPATKHRESTRPADVSSRLLAPTASSRAKYGEGEAAASQKPATGSSAGRLPSSTRPSKPQPSTSKPAPRASTAGTGRPESRSSQPAARRAAPPPGDSGSFLDRMMRPTAASAQKAHEKTEVKSPPRKSAGSAAKKLGPAPKTNGVAKSAPKAGASSKPLSKAALEHAAESSAQEAEKSDVPADAPAEPEKEVEVAGEQVTGAETPVGDSGNAEKDTAALEGTPAFGEEGIR